MSERTTIILINLGTPLTVELKAVRQFLSEFLMDARVIQLPWLLRALCVYGLILPFRSHKTQEAYKSIWDETLGSPLMYHSQNLAKKLSLYLEQVYPNQYTVQLAMRYAGGDLNLKTVMRSLKKNQKVIVLPLYPQYAVSTTESTVVLCLKEAAKRGLKQVEVISDFYDHPGFIEPMAEIIQKTLTQKPDYLLFSYHGLPQKHLEKIGCKNRCGEGACPKVTDVNRLCYRAQCFATTRALARILELKPDTYGVSFQSRLGRLPWITPYTDKKIEVLAEQGVKYLAVVCPSFVADCLETKEEIELRLKARWFELVKKQAEANFSMISCLNDHSKWVAGLAQIIHTNR